MKVDRPQVAEAIRNIEDPFTCSQLLDELGLEKNTENHAQVLKILHYFKERQWVTNSYGNLFFRSFKEFKF